MLSSILMDLKQISFIHISSFPNALSSALGKRYVARMLSWYLSTDKAFIFHIENAAGQCIGYCGGIINDGGLNTGAASGMAQHAFKEAILAFILRPWLVFHPEVRAKWPLLWKNILMKLGLKKKSHFTHEEKIKKAQDPHVGLVVIGVDPKYQGQGYGSILLKEFERKALEEYGIRKLSLTVKADNAQAIRAYEKNGWKKNKLSGNSLQMIKIVE